MGILVGRQSPPACPVSGLGDSNGLPDTRSPEPHTPGSLSPTLYSVSKGLSLTIPSRPTSLFHQQLLDPLVPGWCAVLISLGMASPVTSDGSCQAGSLRALGKALKRVSAGFWERASHSKQPWQCSGNAEAIHIKVNVYWDKTSS